MPSTLIYFSANNSQFSFTTFAPVLDTFICQGCNNITAVPDAPTSLVYLDVSNGSVASMGIIPAYMQDLFLYNNPMTAINLPDVIFDQLYIYSMANLTTINLGATGALALQRGYVNQYYSYGIALEADNCPLATAAISNMLGALTYSGSSGNGAGISASNCNLTAMPVFKCLVGYLNLSHNQIPDLTPQQQVPGYNYYPFDRNAVIKMSYNLLDSIDTLFFTQGAQAQPLYELDLSNNSIATINWIPQTARYISSYPNTDTVGGAIFLDGNGLTNIGVPVYADSFSVKNNPALYCLPYLFGTDYLFTIGSGVTCTPDIPDTVWHSDQ
jgi:hypothetical protein